MNPAEVIMKKQQDRDNLSHVIAQWNANRLDLFELSEPNEESEFHGVMRFYFQDSGQKVATKCIRVASDATSQAVIETLIEKFRPDMRMLSIPEYALYEIHENGDERRLGVDEKPLLVQLNWHIDDREGRFLLRRIDDVTNMPSESFKEGGLSFRRKLSKREKKQLKKQEKMNKMKAESVVDENDAGVAEKLYTELPETSFTRSISNPEAVMRRRRQQKLERKLQQFRSKDGGPDTGGTLKIYGEALCRDVPYKTLLLSVRDSAQQVVKEMINKYGLEKQHEAVNYCLVQVNTAVPAENGDKKEVNGGTNNREYILDDDECPLAILMNHPSSRGSIMFHVRRRPADYHPRKRKKKLQGKNSKELDQRYYDDSNAYNNLPFFLELNPDGSDITSGSAKRHLLRPNVTEVGSERPPSHGNHLGQSLQLFGPNVQPRHCVVAHTENIVTVTPCSRDAETYVNGQRIYETTILQNGSVVKFGRIHSYRFIDPNHDPDRSRQRHDSARQAADFAYDRQSQRTDDEPSTNHSPTQNYETTFDVDGNVETISTSSLGNKDETRSQRSIASSNGNRLSGYERYPRGTDPILPAVLEFREETEEAFIHAVVTDLDPSTAPGFKLAPAYCLYLVARYRASTHYRAELTPTERAHRLTGLLARVAAIIHNVIQERYSDAKLLAFWMANSSELLHFLKCDRHISAFSLDAQDILAECVEIGFRNLVASLQGDLSAAMTHFMSADDSPDDNTGSVLQVLALAMALLRRCRVNAALTIQLFSQLFHYINMWAFNKVVTSPGAAPHNVCYCTRAWGLRLKGKLAQLEVWAERQGLELAADCHLARIIQAAHLLQAPKYSGEDLATLSSTCFKLNSLQLRALLTKYQPTPDEPRLPTELIDNVVRVAENVADELARSDGREIRLEEETELQLPFLLPEDGYSCDVVRGVPQGLAEFLAPLSHAGLCRMAAQPTSSGLWTIYMQPQHTPGGRSPSAMSNRSGGPPASHEPDLQVMKLNKSNNGMGLSIVAAKGAGQDRLGIYIKSVVKGGAADADGQLQAGDQLLKVDGQSLVGITQERAAEYLVRTGPVVTLEVAKQGAIYHGLATLLQQPSPVMTRASSSRTRPKSEHIATNSSQPFPSSTSMSSLRPPAAYQERLVDWTPPPGQAQGPSVRFAFPPTTRPRRPDRLFAPGFRGHRPHEPDPSPSPRRSASNRCRDEKFVGCGSGVNMPMGILKLSPRFDVDRDLFHFDLDSQPNHYFNSSDNCQKPEELEPETFCGARESDFSSVSSLNECCSHSSTPTDSSGSANDLRAPIADCQLRTNRIQDVDEILLDNVPDRDLKLCECPKIRAERTFIRSMLNLDLSSLHDDDSSSSDSKRKSTDSILDLDLSGNRTSDKCWRSPSDVRLGQGRVQALARHFDNIGAIRVHKSAPDVSPGAFDVVYALGLKALSFGALKPGVEITEMVESDTSINRDIDKVIIKLRELSEREKKDGKNDLANLGILPTPKYSTDSVASFEKRNCDDNISITSLPKFKCTEVTAKRKPGFPKCSYGVGSLGNLTEVESDSARRFRSLEMLRSIASEEKARSEEYRSMVDISQNIVDGVRYCGNDPRAHRRDDSLDSWKSEGNITSEYAKCPLFNRPIRSEESVLTSRLRRIIENDKEAAVKSILKTNRSKDRIRRYRINKRGQTRKKVDDSMKFSDGDFSALDFEENNRLRRDNEGGSSDRLRKDEGSSNSRLYSDNAGNSTSSLYREYEGNSSSRLYKNNELGSSGQLRRDEGSTSNRLRGDTAGSKRLRWDEVRLVDERSDSEPAFKRLEETRPMIRSTSEPRVKFNDYHRGETTPIDVDYQPLVDRDAFRLRSEPATLVISRPRRMSERDLPSRLLSEQAHTDPRRSLNTHAPIHSSKSVPALNSGDVGGAMTSTPANQKPHENFNPGYSRTSSTNSIPQQNRSKSSQNLTDPRTQTPLGMRQASNPTLHYPGHAHAPVNGQANGNGDGERFYQNLSVYRNQEIHNGYPPPSPNRGKLPSPQDERSPGVKSLRGSQSSLHRPNELPPAARPASAYLPSKESPGGYNSAQQMAARSQSSRDIVRQEAKLHEMHEEVRRRETRVTSPQQQAITRPMGGPMMTQRVPNTTYPHPADQHYHPRALAPPTAPKPGVQFRPPMAEQYRPQAEMYRPQNPPQGEQYRPQVQQQNEQYRPQVPHQNDQYRPQVPQQNEQYRPQNVPQEQYRPQNVPQNEQYRPQIPQQNEQYRPQIPQQQNEQYRPQIPQQNEQYRPQIPQNEQYRPQNVPQQPEQYRPQNVPQQPEQYRPQIPPQVEQYRPQVPPQTAQQYEQYRPPAEAYRTQTDGFRPTQDYPRVQFAVDGTGEGYRDSPPPPPPPTATHPLYQPRLATPTGQDVRYSAASGEAPRGGFYPASPSAVAGPRQPFNNVATSPWEREEREKDAVRRREMARAWRDAQISELSALAQRSAQQEEQLRALRLEREFQRRAEEQAKLEEEEEGEEEQESVERVQGLLRMATQGQPKHPHILANIRPSQPAVRSPLEEKERLRREQEAIRRDQEAVRRRDEEIRQQLHQQQQQIQQQQQLQQQQQQQQQQAKEVRQPNNINRAANPSQLRLDNLVINGYNNMVKSPPTSPTDSSGAARLDSLLGPPAPPERGSSFQATQGVLRSSGVATATVKRVSFSDPNANQHSPPPLQPPPTLERIREDPNHFINEAELMLSSPKSPDAQFSGNTPGVIGAQEVYKDPRARMLAAAQKQARSGPLPEKLSFKEKMKMFAMETGEDGTPRDKVKISRAQRDIDNLGSPNNNTANTATQ